MAIEVRRITPDDAFALRAVRLAALADAPAAFGSTHERELGFDDAVWVERASGGAAGSDRATFFACDGETIVGLAGGFRIEEGSIDVVSMWTSPQVRRRGVGRMLVGAVFEWAASHGEPSVALWVTQGNDQARRLYESMGFTETGDHQPLPSDPCRNQTRMIRLL